MHENDIHGNILQAVKRGTTHTYTYGDSSWLDLLTAYDQQPILYEGQRIGTDNTVTGTPLSGNPTSYYNGTRWSFSWAEGRRLMTAAKSGTSISYQYDANGIRTSKTVNGVKHDYVYAGGKLIRESYGSTVMDFVYDSNGRPYAIVYNGTVYYYVLNLQGDVVRIVDANGNRMATYHYNAWGELYGITETNGIANANPIRYRGYYYDAETGFYYLQSRYYDPSIGRFINADAFASTGQGFLGYNMFAYCGNNPANKVDSAGYAYRGTNTVAIKDTYGGTGSFGPSILPLPGLDIAEFTQTVVELVGAAAVYAYSSVMNTQYKNNLDGCQTNVHHIIPKGQYSGRSQDVQNNLVYARTMMEDAGISVKSSVWNLIIVSQKYHSRLHTDEYLLRATSAIIDTDGSAEQIKWALVSLRIMIKFDDTEMYWS